jgi:hypothetical protein
MKRFIPLYLILIFSLSVNAQVNYEPVNKSIYIFLENLSIKGLIKFNDEVRPLSRMYIADKLTEMTSKKGNLTNLEAEELDFYLKEYSDEITNKRIKISNSSYNTASDSTCRNDFLRFGKTDRLRFFSYHDKTFTINVDPILGYNLGNQYGASYLHRWNGASVFGSVGRNWGFELNFMDNLEQGDNIDRGKYLTPVSGMNIIKENSNSIQYTFVNANISYNWSWGTISLGKDHQIWGSGKNGQLILSDKAPSFPMIKLELAPTDWLRFVYIHGWLYSGIMDSSSFRYGVVPGRDTYQQIQKYFAAHMVSVDLKNNLTLSLGESIIYSDKLELYYLIPIMFFRIADQNLQRKNSNTGSNAQIFGNIYYSLSDIKAKLYSTIFIDELSIEDLMKGGNLSAIGYTIGGKFVDPLIKNSSLVLEYTKIAPFVYMNSNQVEHYSNYNYPLGYWMGSNGYNVFAEYNQKIIRGLGLTVSAGLVKKGRKELPVQQYESPYPSFLYGAKYEEKSTSIELSYEYIHDLFVKLNYKYTDISDEDKTRTPSYMLGKHRSFGISLYYGM